MENYVLTLSNLSAVTLSVLDKYSMFLDSVLFSDGHKNTSNMTFAPIFLYTGIFHYLKHKGAYTNSVLFVFMWFRTNVLSIPKGHKSRQLIDKIDFFPRN